MTLDGEAWNSKKTHLENGIRYLEYIKDAGYNENLKYKKYIKKPIQITDSGC